MRKLALLLCLGFTQLAHAQEDRGMYFGAGLGSFKYDEGDDDFAVVDDTYSYQLLGGYKFNENFALEGGLGGTGDIKDQFTDAGPFGPVTITVKATYDIYWLDALGILPFDRFSLFGGAGYYSASLSGTVDAEGFGTVGGLDGHDSGATATFGIQRDFGLDLKSVSIRGQYVWYDYEDDIKASGIDIRVLFRF
jgi:OOP family OmpA-OmpF porin